MENNEKSKEYSVLVIVLGIIVTLFFIYIFKYTSFFNLPMVWWKYFLLVIILLISAPLLAFAFPISLSEFIKDKIEKLGIGKNKSEEISYLLLIILTGIIYLWLQ